MANAKGSVVKHLTVSPMHGEISMTNGGLSGLPSNVADCGETQARVTAGFPPGVAATVWGRVVVRFDG